jgi:small-conductance mechanosensitive channel
LLLLGDQPFRPGDWISAGEIEGVVVDVNWRTTHVRTRGGDMIIVPNSQLATASITNYTSPEPLHRVVVPVQVAYVNPPTLAKAMLLDAAAGTPGVLNDPAPVVRVTQIDDPLMGYEVHMWIDDYAIAPSVATDFGTLVWYQSHRHGVPLPSPAQDLYLYDGVAAGEADLCRPHQCWHHCPMITSTGWSTTPGPAGSRPERSSSTRRPHPRISWSSLPGGPSWN